MSYGVAGADAFGIPQGGGLGQGPAVFLQEYLGRSEVAAFRGSDSARWHSNRFRGRLSRGRPRLRVPGVLEVGATLQPYPTFAAVSRVATAHWFVVAEVRPVLKARSHY